MDRQTLAEVFNYDATETTLRRWWCAQSEATRAYEHNVAGFFRLVALTYGKKRGSIRRLRMPNDKIVIPCNGDFYRILAVKYNTDEVMNYLYDRTITFLAESAITGVGVKYTEIGITNLEPFYWHTIALEFAKEIDKELSDLIKQEEDMPLPWEEENN